MLLADPDVRGAYIIKRLVAVAGDPVPAGFGDGLGPVVPDGKVLLLGDNPAYSVDSRLHGPYDHSGILGVAIF